MNRTWIVFHKETKEFLMDRGTLFFHFCGIVIVGIAVPLFFKNEISQPLLALLFPIQLLKQWAADSFASEKENKTLETLLSSPIKMKNLFRGKFFYCAACAAFYFVIIMALLIFVKSLTEQPFQMAVWEGLCAAMIALSTICCTALVGVYISATSDNARAARSRLSFFVYPVYLVLIVLISLLTQHLTMAFILLSIMFLLIAFGISINIFFSKAGGLTRSALLGEKQHKGGTKK